MQPLSASTGEAAGAPVLEVRVWEETCCSRAGVVV